MSGRQGLNRHRSDQPGRRRCRQQRARVSLAARIDAGPWRPSRMTIWVGTSGYNYPEWKGSFYPEKLPTAKMLPYYAERFPTVEINYTFYRTPQPRILQGWSQQTPEPFRFSLKAPKRITHVLRLRECASQLDHFCSTAATLGPKLGALL